MTVTASRQDTPRNERLQRRYLRPTRPIHFPAEEEVPETRRHLDLRTALYLAIRDTFADCATVGSDQFVYWDPTDPTQRCAPDVFVRLGQPDAQFDVWKVWERGAPDLAVEVISASDAADRPWEAKLRRYRKVGVQELVRFDPEDETSPLRIWDLVDGDLVERDPTDPIFRKCDALDCFWCLRPDQPSGVVLYLSHDEDGAHPCITNEEARRRDAEAGRLEAERRVQELEAELSRLRRQR